MLFLIKGDIYPSVCVASWTGPVNKFKAGSKASVLILARDAFGNNISSSPNKEEPIPFNFTLSSSYPNGSIVSDLDVKHTGWIDADYLIIEFLVLKAGNFLLHIQGKNQSLIGSPLPFSVEHGKNVVVLSRL